MEKVLFVCHGNICRSPMAEFVLKKLVSECQDLDVYAESAATSNEETGNYIYPPAARKLREKGIPFDKSKTARKLTIEDYFNFDYIVVMDNMNLRNVMRIIREDYDNKVSLLLDFTDTPGREISDPWYTDNFERAFNDILEGCKGLINFLRNGKHQKNL